MVCLNFNHTATNYVFAPLIAGNGSVNVYSGTTTLTANNTCTGATTISGGALIVNGSIASSALTTVNSSGLLGGFGTVGNTQINAGGTFAPGPQNTPGAMTVAGNLAFQPGALYLVQVGATASIANVTGTATLAGNVLANFAPGSNFTRQYTILHADGGLGGTTFGGVGTNNPNFNASLVYDANNVFLHLTAALGNSVNGLSQNQINVTTAINGFFNNGGVLPPNFAPRGLAGGLTNWGLASGLGGGNSDVFQAGLCGITRNGPVYLAGALAFAEHWMSTDRFAFAGDHLTARFNAQNYGGRLEGGWRFATFLGGVAPYAAVQAQAFHTPAYNELDGTLGGFGLNYNARNGSDTCSE
jgi:autotransporter-associated beta strand protein